MNLNVHFKKKKAHKKRVEEAKIYAAEQSLNNQPIEN